MKPHSSLALVAALSVLAMPAAPAALVLVDLSDNGGSAAGWDVFTTNVTDAAVTDQNSIDNDVTLTITGLGGENNLGAPGTSATIDGVTVPLEARDDYVWGAVNGGTALFEFKNLDAGIYSVSVFEGRTSDGNQVGRIWAGTAGDDPGSENTGNFAGGSSTLTVTIGAGDSLFYVHQEDNTGGTSGLIVNPIPEPSAAILLSLGGLALLRRRRACCG
jgi:hypothetical protein